MKVLKFGGTSVGSAENMRMVSEIIQSEGSRVTVLSAMSETTNGLVKICASASNGIFEKESFDYLKAKYTKCVENLLKSQDEALTKIESAFSYIKQQAENFTTTSENNILAQGELLTTAIFTMFLNESGLKARLLNVPEYMQTNSEGRADESHLDQTLGNIVKSEDSSVFFVTQGFICTNHLGELDNLGRGGSDYSAALIGAAIDADEVQIWTDIDGMHNNDPRYVENTYPIHKMSFTQAAELAYFGAKILHPATIQPCKKRGIPVRLKNTLDAAAEGTLITNCEDDNTSKYLAVAAKDGVISIRINSARMLMAYGFLRRLFEVFEKYKTPIDMITTSEVAVTLTIDSDEDLEGIVADLKPFGNVSYEKNNSIICVVGDIDPSEKGVVAKILDSITDIPVKMISYGASDNSVAFMISSENKIEALRKLNCALFENH
ncbi:MAG: aspartate kinase [Rikenellaceae bacterium]